MARSLAEGVEVFTHHKGSDYMVLYFLALETPVKYEATGYVVFLGQIAQQAHVTLRQLSNILDRLAASGDLEILTAEESAVHLNPGIPVNPQHLLYYRVVVYPRQRNARKTRQG